MISVFIILTVGLSVDAGLLPPDIELCHKSDPQLNKCLERAFSEGLKKFAAGYKPLGISPLEPFFVPVMDLGESQTGSVSLAQQYENVKFYGFSGSVISNVEISIIGDDCFWGFSAFTPQTRMEADYKLKGKILIFPINGHGKCTNYMYNLTARHEMKCEKYNKHGKKHIRILSYDININDASKVMFNFENIVDGNEQISKEIGKTVNENGLTVFNDVKNGFGQVFSLIYKETLNRVFAKISEDELFLD